MCYVYVDDVLIFSESESDHVKHIDTVLKRLLDASMRVAREKTKFIDAATVKLPTNLNLNCFKL